MNEAATKHSSDPADVARFRAERQARILESLAGGPQRIEGIAAYCGVTVTQVWYHAQYMLRDGRIQREKRGRFWFYRS